MKKVTLLLSVPLFIVAMTATTMLKAQCMAEFTSSAPGCVGQDINFYAADTLSGTTFSWDFGGGTPNTSSVKNPTGIVYSSSGVKIVTLIVNNGGCDDTIVNAVVINPNPTIGFSSSAPECMGIGVDFTNASDTGVGLTYLWDFGSGAMPSSSNAYEPQDVIYSTSGSKSVTLIVNNGNCTVTDIQSITINTTPVADLSSTAPACTGEGVDFVNTGTSGATSYSWTFGSGSVPSSSSTENQSSVVYSTAGVKTVTLTTVIGTCSDMMTKTVTINQKPTASFTSNAPQCANNGVDFTNTGSTGGNWMYDWDFGTGSSPSSATAEDPSGVTFNSGGSKSVTLTVSDADCSADVTNSITVNESPMVSFASTAPACSDDTVSFTNTGSTGGSWTYSWNLGSGATPATSSSENPAGVVYSTAGTKSIMLTTTDGTCSESVVQTITINLQPTASFTSTAPDCGNVGIDFSNTGSTGGTWAYSWDFGVGASPITSAAENPSGVMYSNSGTKTVTLTISNGNCTETVSQSIVVNATPMANFTSTAPSCELDSVDFTNTGSTGGSWTYAWSFGSGSAPASSTDENPVDIIYSSFGIKMIMLVVTDGVCSDTSMQTININDRPSVGFSSTAPVCAGSNVNFINSGSSGTNWSYGWDFGEGATPSNASSENPQGIYYDDGGTKTITFTISDANCTETFSDTITINALPIADAGSDTIICANRCVQIGSASVAGNTYSWFPSNTLDNAMISDPTSCPEANINTYFLMVMDSATGCMDMDSVSVTMLLPLNADAGIDVEICFGDSVQIGAALVEGQFYSWTPSLGLSSTTSSYPMVSTDSTMTDTAITYTVTVADDYGCDPVTDQVVVTVHPLPIAEAGDSVTIARGAEAQLLATGGIMYSWSPAMGLSNISIPDPLASPADIGIYVYTVVVTDVFNCMNSDSVVVTVVEPILWTPTAFTPNGDGQNDVFYVRIDESGITDFEFRVYDRLGGVLFHSQDVNMGWDGTKMLTGKNLPGGAYVFNVQGITSLNETVNISGLINLIR
ncbi:MAG: hypothetical protein COB85_03270 [Bacteroidetes bacterium]|nr:MAG: hypothetical protein COB85_03270 [Bacteroidota bacterium]